MAEWLPTDYILRGTYCPNVDLGRKLRQYRSRYRHAAVVMFTVCDVDRIQKPIIVPDVADSFQAPIGSLLHRLSIPTDDLHRSVSDAVFAVEGRRAARLEKVAAKIAALLGKDLPDGADVYLTTPDDMHPNSPVRPVALLIGPQRFPHKRLDLLYSMLVTSVQVRQAIDRAALSPLDALLLIPSIKSDGGIDMLTMADRALQRAVSDTGSDLGAIHWHASRGEISGSDPDVVAAILDAIDRDPEELLAEMHTINRADQYVGDDCVVLACPIPGVLAGPQSPGAGVLLLRRPGRTLFSSHAIARCRAICIRLAVVWATAGAGEVARLIVDLSSPSPTAAVRGAEGAYRSDVDLALDGLTPALERIAISTNSQSVTLRLARGVMVSGDDHGVVLERATTVPPLDPELATRLTQQSETIDRGLNWQAVRTGRSVAAADVADHKDYHPLRGETRSQLSLPVRMGPRLVGTLNLESVSSQNYGTFEPYGRLIADAVGRRLAAASMIVSQPVIERAAQVLDHTHGYHNRLRRLREIALTLPIDQRERERIVAYADECLDLIKSAIQGLPPSDGPTPSHGDAVRVPVGETVQHELDTSIVYDLEYVNDWADVAALTRTLPEAAARCVGAAVHGILTNIKKHLRARYGQSPPAVWFGECTWDGQPHAVIVFTNPTRTTLPPEVAAQVYRTPVQRGVTGELQLGAYLTGLALRPINGWVTFAVEDSLARTVLFVPVPVEETAA